MTTLTTDLDIAAPIDCADLAELARNDPAGYRTRLARLTDEQLVRQATAYAAYSTGVTGKPVSTDEVLARFQRSIAATRPAPAAPAYKKEIVYDRETRDYALYLDGELVGFARTYHEAEVTLDQLVFELVSGQYFRGAA